MEAVVAKNHLSEKELWAMGQLVSGYLDFAGRQAEREQAMTMKDQTKHLDRILTISGEQLLQENGSITNSQSYMRQTNYCWIADIPDRGGKLFSGIPGEYDAGRCNGRVRKNVQGCLKTEGYLEKKIL